MSHRKRHPSKTLPAFAPGGYPSPEERQAIIEQRDRLFMEVIRLLVENRTASDPAFRLLEQRYEKTEIQRQLSQISRQAAERDFLIDEPLLYCKYRQIFARFGGERRFLGRIEHEALVFEHATLMARRKFMTPGPTPAPTPRECELYDLLLANPDAWEDITPPAIPPRPAHFYAPQPASYAGPEQQLLTWDWKPDLPRILALAKEKQFWQPALPALLRMVFDKGLLNGWPGEPASWAPYHALHLLGALQATELAARLLALAGNENDWLSDRLPATWTLMGPTVEPVLWRLLVDRTYEDDPRGLVVAGLHKLAATYQERRQAIIQGLMSALKKAAPDDATVNAYIVFVLNKMKASQSKAVIAQAFAQGKVNTRIMQSDDVNFC